MILHDLLPICHIIHYTSVGPNFFVRGTPQKKKKFFWGKIFLKLFAPHYAFSRHPRVLRDIVRPTLHYTKILKIFYIFADGTSVAQFVENKSNYN